MPTSQLEPAASIIHRLGGVDAVATHLGIHKSRVFRWRAPKDRDGGTGGTIPQRHHVGLLDMARHRDVPLTAGDFLARSAARSAPQPGRASA